MSRFDDYDDSIADENDMRGSTPASRWQSVMRWIDYHLATVMR
jgi:hypothetical protein